MLMDGEIFRHSLWKISEFRGLVTPPARLKGEKSYLCSGRANWLANPGADRF